MSEKIVQFNEEIIKGQIKELVRGSVEEALIEMYLAGVSVRRVEDITEALWGSKVSPATISELNKKAYVHIEDWRNRPLQGGHYPYVHVLLGKHADTGNVVRNQTAHAGDSAVLTSMYSAMRRS